MQQSSGITAIHRTSSYRRAAGLADWLDIAYYLGTSFRRESTGLVADGNDAFYLQR
jgi:hypothetical protein